MRSAIAILDTLHSGPGQSLTLVGYNSVFPDLYQIHDLPHHDRSNPDRAPSFSVCCVGVIKRDCRQMVMLQGDVC